MSTYTKPTHFFLPMHSLFALLRRTVQLNIILPINYNFYVSYELFMSKSNEFYTLVDRKQLFFLKEVTKRVRYVLLFYA